MKVAEHPPRSTCWTRFPESLGDDLRLQACALAYLSDVNAMGAVHASYPGDVDHEMTMGASLDHAIWFQRPVRANEWLLVDMTGHGMIGSRGLATGLVFDPKGTHVATIAQEGLLRQLRKAPG